MVDFLFKTNTMMLRCLGAMGWLLLVSACQADREPLPPPADGDRLVVGLEGLYLRAVPGPEGSPLRALPVGTPLEDLERVSRFTTRITLQGRAMNEPWLYVRTDDGTEGWVYGGVLHFVDLPEERRQALLRRKRLAALFDASFADSLAAYRALYEAATTDTALQRAYRRGRHLRETLVEGLQQRAPAETSEELPDLFWLSAFFPGFVPQRVAEGTDYYFFADYGDWLQRAHRTGGKADDAYFELCVAAFPEDSIEYFYPAWTIQTWDYGGHSLLGRGIHRSLLRQADRRLAGDSPFAAEVQTFVDQLIDDITAPQNSYWEDTSLIVRELEEILTDSIACLKPRDQIALEGRLEQFRAPNAYDLRVNLRAGE